MNKLHSQETTNKWHVEHARQLPAFLPQCYSEKEGLEVWVTYPMQGTACEMCAWLLNCHTAALTGDTWWLDICVSQYLILHFGFWVSLWTSFKQYPELQDSPTKISYSVYCFSPAVLLVIFSARDDQGATSLKAEISACAYQCRMTQQGCLMLSHR